MSIMQNIKRGIQATLDDLIAKREEERARQEAADRAYAADPSDRAWAAKEAADRAYAQADTRVRVREREEEERARKAAEDERRKVRARLDEALATAAGLDAALAPFAARAAAMRRELCALNANATAALQRQGEAVHRATALAKQLGVDVDVPTPAHPGTLRGYIGRALWRDVQERGDDPRADVHELLRPLAH